MAPFLTALLIFLAILTILRVGGVYVVIKRFFKNKKTPKK